MQGRVESVNASPSHSAATRLEEDVVQEAGGDQHCQVAAAQRHEGPDAPLLPAGGFRVEDLRREEDRYDSSVPRLRLFGVQISPWIWMVGSWPPPSPPRFR